MKLVPVVGWWHHGELCPGKGCVLHVQAHYSQHRIRIPDVCVYIDKILHYSSTTIEVKNKTNCLQYISCRYVCPTDKLDIYI